MTVDGDWRRAVAAAGVGELVWRDGRGRPVAHGVVPLLLGERPAVALPWVFEREAREVAAGGVCALVLSEPRLTGPGWFALALVGSAELLVDDDGTLVQEHLLDQELRKHPPSRALADSPLLRREHWWYLPRLVLTLADYDAVALTARRDPSDAVLAVATEPGGLAVAVVRVADWDTDELVVVPRSPGDRLPPGGPALLVGQELSVPDVERWTVHVTHGRHRAGRFEVAERPAGRDLEPVPGLVARWRRQRALERGCIRALEAHRRREGG